MNEKLLRKLDSTVIVENFTTHARLCIDVAVINNSDARANLDFMHPTIIGACRDESCLTDLELNLSQGPFIAQRRFSATRTNSAETVAVLIFKINSTGNLPNTRVSA